MVEPEAKRPRLEGGEYVFFSCFDEPDKLVKADMSLLKDCRLASLVRNQSPESAPDGKLYWNCSMTRAMLITFLRSMTLGELVLSKGVSTGEALATFEYEGISLMPEGGEQHPIQQPRQGVGFSKLAEPVSDVITQLCTQIADAIVQWPRLEVVLDAALGRQGNSVFGIRSYGGNVTATSNRAWIRFADRPRNVESDSSNFVQQLVMKNPRWFSESLIAIGIVHHRLSVARPDFAKQRDEQAFKILCKEIEKDSLGSFFSVRTDYVKGASDQKTKREINRGERFYNEIRQSILSSQDVPEDYPLTVQIQYANAIVTFVENMMNTAPNCSRVFSAACCDENGGTPERLVLKNMLKTRGVRIIRWIEERDANIRPIVFPPSWREQTHTSCYGPSMLLSFDGLR